MAHFSSRIVLGFIPVLALFVGAVGCVAEVDTGEGEGEDSDGNAVVVGECKAYEGECEIGDEQPCGAFPDSELDPKRSCIVIDEKECKTGWDPTACNTPLVLSFDGAAVEFSADATRAFDVNGAASQVTDWPAAITPWLAIDRDHSGSIEDGRELFGSMSKLSSGGTASNGFIALRELDQNGDGKITAEDPGFAELLVWSDRDRDRASSTRELSSASAWEIVSIDLDYASIPRCDARGNCEVERASFQYRDVSGALRTGTVIDVRLPPQR